MKDEVSLKPQYGWTVSLFLPFTPYFAKKFVERGISANFTSWLSLFVFLIGLYFYVFYNEYIWARVIAVVFFMAGTFFDVLDGAVARLSATTSKFGSALDTVIDLIRYDLFFASLFFIYSPSTLDILFLLFYLLLLNYSFVSFLIKLKNDTPIQKTSSLYEPFLPDWYKSFCLKYRFLYNPLNLEDQLLFLFFVLGVLFKIELVVIYIAVFARLFDVYLVLRNRTS